MEFVTYMMKCIHARYRYCLARVDGDQYPGVPFGSLLLSEEFLPGAGPRFEPGTYLLSLTTPLKAAHY
jgi:hypothetical protein